MHGLPDAPPALHYHIYICAFVCLLIACYSVRRLRLIPTYVLRMPWTNTAWALPRDARSNISNCEYTENVVPMKLIYNSLPLAVSPVATVFSPSIPTLLELEGATLVCVVSRNHVGGVE